MKTTHNMVWVAEKEVLCKVHCAKKLLVPMSNMNMEKNVKQNNITLITSNIEDTLLDLSMTNYYYQNRQWIWMVLYCKVIPAFILRIRHWGPHGRIWNWNHFTFCNSIYCMSTNFTNLPSFCYKQHVIRLQKFDKPWKKTQGQNILNIYIYIYFCMIAWWYNLAHITYQRFHNKLWLI